MAPESAILSFDVMQEVRSVGQLARGAKSIP
jgi:hypothetical protein